MTLHAFKNGLTILNQDNLNSLLALQPFQLIYEGTQRAGKTGSGVNEASIAEYSYCTRFALSGSTEISRVELEVDRDGDGADLILQIRSGMNPAAGDDGTLLKQVVVPKEFIPTTKAYWSIPVGLTGLTSGGQYWLVVKRNGDAVNKVDWIGETAQDASHPAYYRAGDSGAWTAENAIHFKVFSGESGKIVHTIEGENGVIWLTYNGDMYDTMRMYLPDAVGGAGIRQIITFSYSGGLLKKGVVT